MIDVSIEGGGVAAACCAFLLRRAGLSVGVSPAVRAPLPAILLGEQAQQLICDLFERPALFRDFPRIRRRIVAWGAGAQPVTLPHSAVVVAEAQLLRCLDSAPVDSGEDAARWTISTSRRGDYRQFGTRTAAAAEVRLREDAEPEACWIEAVDRGWLFLIAAAPGSGWVLAVGDAPDSLLSGSRLVASRAVGIGNWTGSFPAAPRIAAPLCGPGWLACGSAAMAFDPLCGDGTAHSVREAILASAIVRAAAAGEDAASLLAHYRSRLTAAFQRHLGVCLSYYRSGGAGPWWQCEADALDQGMEWCHGELRESGGFRYRLEGLTIRRHDAADGKPEPA